MKVRLGLEAFVGGAGKLALNPGLNSFLSNAPQPSAPSLVLTEVFALDRTSASAPPAGQGSTAAWVSRRGAPSQRGGRWHLPTHCGALPPSAPSSFW